jgi:hypothetical protein
MRGGCDGERLPESVFLICSVGGYQLKAHTTHLVDEILEQIEKLREPVCLRVQDLLDTVCLWHQSE